VVLMGFILGSHGVWVDGVDWWAWVWVWYGIWGFV
jgi:hypothetical protein